jgi:hypothetical protein
MNLLSDIITYVRRIVKTPSNNVLSDNLIIDYINRFWIMDVDARIQLFDLKTKYQFQTAPGVDRYNMPLYSVQTEPGSQTVGMYPVYQGFTSPAYINGIQVPLQTQKSQFFNIYPNVVQNLQVVDVGNGGVNYNLTLPIVPNSTTPSNPPFNGLIRGHIDISGIIGLNDGNIDPPFYTSANAVGVFPALGSIERCPVTSVDAAVFITSIDANGNSIVVSDSGQFLKVGVENMANYGLLINPGAAPFGNSALSGGYSTTLNTVNYLTGAINVTFPVGIPTGNNINVQCFYFQSGLPRAVLFYNNTLTLRSPPATQYLVELDAYLSPAAFLNTSSAIPFGYMAEYIARGAARKLLSDTGDWDQFDRYEPQFREQEILVWKRSQRQFTNNRTETLYSQGFNFGSSNGSLGGGNV